MEVRIGGVGEDGRVEPVEQDERRAFGVHCAQASHDDSGWNTASTASSTSGTSDEQRRIELERRVRATRGRVCGDRNEPNCTDRGDRRTQTRASTSVSESPST